MELTSIRGEVEANSLDQVGRVNGDLDKNVEGLDSCLVDGD